MIVRKPDKAAGDKAEMLLAADALRLTDGEDALVDLVPGATVSLGRGRSPLLARLTRSTAQARKWLTMVGTMPGRSLEERCRTRSVSMFCSHTS